MLRSRNVTLRRSSDAPLRRLREAYGSEDDAETSLEQFVLAGERRAKGRAAALTLCDSTAQLRASLLQLLADLSDYGALGKMGGADQRFCQRVQPLLTRLMKCILSGGFDMVDENSANTAGTDGGEEEENNTSLDAEALLQAASRALANCSDGVARRCADTTLEVQLDDAPSKPGARDCHSEAPSSAAEATSPSVLRVCFGFADYTSGETGAMLWAGAVGLSLYLIENFASLVLEKARQVYTDEGRPLRVVELGCGPALVSLVMAAMVAREGAAEVRCRLDVTDISATVVEEAQRSFQQRNGAQLATMVTSEEGTGDARCSHNGHHDRVGPLLEVCPFVLDFGAIPHELTWQYDLVVASDVVYDHAIAAHVAPALEQLLRPGGVALLCCEAHRDGMAYFTNRIRSGQADAEHLRVVAEVRDVQEVLSRLRMLSSLTASTCSLMRIEKVAA